MTSLIELTRQDVPALSQEIGRVITISMARSVHTVNQLGALQMVHPL